jgi:hypothetical protein
MGIDLKGPFFPRTVTLPQGRLYESCSGAEAQHGKEPAALLDLTLLRPTPLMTEQPMTFSYAENRRG